MLFIAAVFAGAKKYYALRARCETLYSVRRSVKQTAENLKCMCLPLYECFERCDGIFNAAFKYMNEGLAPEDAVKKAADKSLFLKNDDKKLLFDFASGLNADNCESQIANAALLEKNIDMQIESAQHDFNTRGKLCLQGGVLLGAAAVLILI